MGFPPPEPATVEFVIGTEDHWNGFAVFSPNAVRPVCNFFQDRFVLIMCRTAGDDVPYRRFRERVHPVKTAFRYGIDKMPGSRDNATAVVGSFCYFFCA